MTITIATSPLRASLFFFLYAWFRPVDDVLDGDDPSPPEDIEGFIREKEKIIFQFARNELVARETNNEDRLLLACGIVADRLGMRTVVNQCVSVIWSLMVTEYRWQNHRTVPTRRELYEFAARQDEAIFRFSALILGANPQILIGIDFDRSGILTRIDWLYDLEDDIAHGLVHLPSDSYPMESAVNVARQELLLVAKEWEQRESQRTRLAEAFSNRFSATIYRQVIKRFEQQVRSLCRKYRVQ